MNRLLGHTVSAAMAAGLLAWLFGDAVAEAVREPDSLLHDWLTWPGVTL